MFKIAPLRYDVNAFERLSSKSFEIHYGKHHVTYVNNLNALLEKNPVLKDKGLDEIIRFSYSKRDDPVCKKIFNNAAQHWNHSFFWECITPGGTVLDGPLLKKIIADFSSVDILFDQFMEIGLSVFGSGWVWIVYNKHSERIEIKGTSNADTPIQTDCLVPILVCDVWEHAYYIDFLNNRKEFLTVVFGYFNWKFASCNYEKK